ncbi:MAG: radical SAM protein [Leptolyngbyaceae cyanobacterium bins.349]|nr:radical SAM protein [Leptolyngbyaceae cyanobacterium bins.349]
MYSITHHSFCSVYGPVRSWRYGISLGIDPIGTVSTCSFDCVYCQLGEIEHKTRDRQIFIPTIRILDDLHRFIPWDVDVITLSGSGEPTLALNLGEIISVTKTLTNKPVGVLTNGSLLMDGDVQEELALADQVAVKWDAVTVDGFNRVNRPVAPVFFSEIWAGLMQFRQHYSGHLAIQTMLLTPWPQPDQDVYIAQMQALQPAEIQLNTPTRPRPLTHQLEARGNHVPGDRAYPTRSLKPTSAETLHTFSDRIQAATGIQVRSALGVTA